MQQNVLITCQPSALSAMKDLLGLPKMLGPYVDLIISFKRPYCKDINNVTGRQANKARGTMIKDFPRPKTMYIVAPKAIIIDAMERNKLIRPIINLFGRVKRKSASAQRELRMDKNINTEAVDAHKEREFAKANRIKGFCLLNMGNPLSVLLPPGIVIAEAKPTVAISTAAIMPEFAVSFSHFSPSATRSLCSSVNTIAGVFPAEFSFTL